MRALRTMASETPVAVVIPRTLASIPVPASSTPTRMGTNLKYDTTPNWETYDAFLRMSNALLERLKPLGAKDMIDVQQFMWVTKDLD